MTKMMKKGPKPSTKKASVSKGGKKTTTKVKVKQPSARARRAQKQQEPKVIENTKDVIFLRGTKTSETVGGLLKDLYALRKPHGKMLQRKNDNMHPFEDASSLEFLCQKNDCSIFAVANHSKKRPNNLTIGRTFDGHLLDMVELGVDSSTTLSMLQRQYPEATIESKRLGSKPCVVFVGEQWEATSEHRNLRSILLDFVRGQDVTGINLASLDHVIAFTFAMDKIFMRTYSLQLKKPADSSTNVPRTKLVLSAPAADFSVRRTRWASKDLMKQALKQPRELKAKKVKNISTSALGETLGQIHMERQDYGEMQTRKTKALHAHKATPILQNGEQEQEHETKDE